MLENFHLEYMHKDKIATDLKELKKKDYICLKGVEANRNRKTAPK